MAALPGLSLDPKDWGYGTWVYWFVDALRARTPRTIEDFIKRAVPTLINLLCGTCSEHAFEIIQKHHPSNYTEIYDDRSENIGMFIWILDIHNLVNRKRHHPTYSREKVVQMFSAVYTLTTKQIEEDRISAMSAETMTQLWEVDFAADDNYKGGSHQKELPGLDLDPKLWGYGLWVSVFFDALRSRTARTIANFIKRNVPILAGLLCGTCSEHAFEFIRANHPSKYKSDEHENMSMFRWTLHLHNLVNQRLSKPLYLEERVRHMFAPLYNLTTEEISEDREASMDVTRMSLIGLISFDPETSETKVPVKTIPSRGSAKKIIV